MEADLLAVVRAERAEALKREVEQNEGGTLELGYSEGHCTPFRIRTQAGQNIHGYLCGVRAPRRRCQFCKTKWSIAQCDYPVGGPCKKCGGTGQTRIGAVEVIEHDPKDTVKTFNCHDCAGTGRAMCNKRVCDACRAHLNSDEDYCPDHRQLAGLPLPVKREDCLWTSEAAALVRRDCLHKGCGNLLEFGGRVLFFPQRKRAMCEACGEAYLQIAIG